jgi:fatty-acyl-CoA synthase
MSPAETGRVVSLVTGLAEARGLTVVLSEPKWQERPLAFIVPNGAEVTLDAVRVHLESLGWARWQLPGRMQVIDRIPTTSGGKFDKKALRGLLQGG